MQLVVVVFSLDMQVKPLQLGCDSITEHLPEMVYL